MKKKTAFISICLAATIFASGCTNDRDKQTPDSLPESVSSEIQKLGAVVSVEDIKNAYKYDDSKNIMPLYNVSPTENFEFTFNFDAFETNVKLYDFVSVHTDADCEEASKIYYTAELSVENGKTKLFVKPMKPVLANDSQDKDYAYDDIDSWGNAPMYYIAVHYDMEENSAKKLDKPVVIPFTVKQEAEAPSIKGNVSADGRFSLSWEPVAGAEKYIVYNLLDSSLKTGADNHAIDGSKVGYDCGENATEQTQLYLLREGETTNCVFDGFSGPDSHSLALITSDFSGKDSNSGQNFGVMGEYFVTAVVNGKESGLSNSVSTAELSLPHIMKPEGKIQGRYPTPADFPAEVEVVNIDGTSSKRKVTYSRSHVKWFEFEWDEYDYTVEGTYIFGAVMFDEDKGEPPVSTVSSGETGNVAPTDEVDKTPAPEVETIISDSKKNENAPLVEAQSANTEKHVESAKTETVENVPAEIYVNADNAEESWLALNLINQNEKISLEAFPSLQNPYTLVDVFYKTYYQNPYIMGIDAFSYDYPTFTLSVKYTLDKNSASDKQKKIAEKAQKIVSENIRSNMSQTEKIDALYSYLVNNSVYDKEALEEAEKNDFKKTANSAHKDAFNAYGILVDEKGVCMSYAYSFKLLCDLSGVDCTVVTGYLNGNLPHAWNMVQIDGKMYEIDCTNNAVNTGIPYYLYQADSSLAAKSGYTKDEKFELDAELSEFVGNDENLEYYRKNGLCPETIEKYSEILVKNLTPDTKTFAVRYDGEINKTELEKAIALAYNKLGLEEKLKTLRYGAKNGFIVIINN